MQPRPQTPPAQLRVRAACEWPTGHVYLVGTSLERRDTRQLAWARTRVNAVNRKHRMAGSRRVSTDVLDSVLADFGRESVPAPRPQAKRKPSRHTKRPAAPADGLKHLEKLFAQLFPADLQQQLVGLAGKLAGRDFESLETNQLVVDRLNRILRGTDLVLVSEEGTPVRLRLVKPARSQYGYFQLRSADAQQNTVYSGARFPPLRVVEKP